jgi:hypothetical protein
MPDQGEKWIFGTTLELLELPLSCRVWRRACSPAANVQSVPNKNSLPERDADQPINANSARKAPPAATKRSKCDRWMPRLTKFWARNKALSNSHKYFPNLPCSQTGSQVDIYRSLYCISDLCFLVCTTLRSHGSSFCRREIGLPRNTSFVKLVQMECVNSEGIY